MIPDYPQFKSITLEDTPEIARAVHCLDAEESELTPATFYIWQDTEIPALTRINGKICIHITCGSERFFLEPLGFNDLPDTLQTCLEHTGCISRISERLAAHPALQTSKLHPIPDQFDYLYLRRDLAEMKGIPYDGKRNHIKRFKARFPDWSYQAIRPEHAESALALFDTWCDRKKTATAHHPFDESCQRKALIRAFSAFDQLGLAGGFVRANNQFLGFILGSPLNEKNFVVHFQYGHPNAPGVMPLLLQESARSSFAAYEHLNLEQDIGIAGLRKSKLSLHPIRLVRKHHLDEALLKTACVCLPAG
jgi:hypothetical protein